MSKVGQKIAIHQFHPYASPGDAITNQMFFIQQALRDIGVAGEIFARKFPTDLEDRVKPFRAKDLWDSDLLLIHHSLGYPQLSELMKVEIPKALVYHNVTPPEFFRHNSVLKKLAVTGRSQLKHLKRYLIASFADSQYNADELETLGYRNTKVMPLFDLAHADSTPVRHFPRKGTLRLLFVGRLAPNKNQAMLLEMFAHLKSMVSARAELILVGGGDPIYTDYIMLLRKHLGLTLSVQIHGHVTDEKLEQLYRSADGFVCLSQHEGFCIPLVEAMRYDVPVFAAPVAAVTETLGDAGVQLLSPDNPRLTAQVITKVLETEGAREKIILSQRARLRELKEIQNPKRVQDLLSALVHEVRHRPTASAAAVPASW